jgi:hypothetical protein
MQGLFVFQSVLSSVGQHLVDPDCELSLFTPAEAFYRKNIMYACFPLLAVVLPWTFWWMASRLACCSKDRGWRGRSGVLEDRNKNKAKVKKKEAEQTEAEQKTKEQTNNTKRSTKNQRPKTFQRLTTSFFTTPPPNQEHQDAKHIVFSNKDKAILSTVVGLYLLYPTTTLQTFSLLSCKEVGNGFWLTADLEEPCYQDRHLIYFFFLVLPQLLVYIIGLPALSLFFMWRNRQKIKTNHPVVMFRFGLLFAGYRHERYYWETIMATRKVVVVAIGVFGRLTDTESQVHGALLALFVFILMHTTLVPFPTDSRPGKSVGNLETFALTCCFLTMYD